jgi:hypothetical protein
VADPKIIITADTSQAERSLKDLDRALEGLNSVAGGAAKALAGIAAAGAAVGFAISKTLGSVDELAKSSRQLGMSGAGLQAFRNSAELAGISSDELTLSLRKLQNNIGDAMIKGTGPAKDALDRLGISMKDLRGIGADKQFEKIAAEIAKIPDPAQRSAVAMDLLGKQGPRLLEAANETERLRKEAEMLGIALSDVDTAAIERAGDAITEINQIFSGALQKAVADIAPFIEAIATKIKTAIMNAGGFEAVWKRIKSAIRDTINVAAILVAIVAVSKLAAGAIALYRAIVLAKGAMALFNAVVMKNPLLLAVGAAILLAKVLGVDVVKYMDEFLGLSDAAAGIVQDIEGNIKEAAENQEQLVEAVIEFNDEQKKALAALDEQISKSAIQVALQQDILRLGQEEANIRAKVAEEARKLAKVSLDLSDAEVASRLKVYETNLRNEQSIKNQIANQTELSRIVNESLKDNSNVAKAVENLNRLKALAAGEDLKQLEEARKVGIANSKEMQAKALENAENAVNLAIRSEIGKFDKLLMLEREYGDQKDKFDTAQRAIDQQSDKLKIENTRLLNSARLSADLEYQNSKIEIERQTQEKLLQMEMNGIQQKLMLQRDAIAKSLSDADRAVLKRAGQEERQKAIVSDRISFEMKSEDEKYAFGINAAAQMFTALGAQNKKAFEAAKAFNIANAIMNTYMAATKALATYPPPFSFIAAAAAIGMGLAQVAQIRSQQYSGREKGGPVAGGMPYMVGEAGPEIFRPSTSGTIIPNNELGGAGSAVNVNFTINAVDTTNFDDLLINRRGVITQIIRDAMVENGQRGI